MSFLDIINAIPAKNLHSHSTYKTLYLRLQWLNILNCNFNFTNITTNSRVHTPITWICGTTSESLPLQYLWHHHCMLDYPSQVPILFLHNWLESYSTEEAKYHLQPNRKLEGFHDLSVCFMSRVDRCHACFFFMWEPVRYV